MTTRKITPTCYLQECDTEFMAELCASAWDKQIESLLKDNDVVVRMKPYVIQDKKKWYARTRYGYAPKTGKVGRKIEIVTPSYTEEI